MPAKTAALQRLLNGERLRTPNIGPRIEQRFDFFSLVIKLLFNYSQGQGSPEADNRKGFDCCLGRKMGNAPRLPEAVRFKSCGRSESSISA